MTEKVTIIGTLNMEVIVSGIEKLPDWGRQIHAENCQLTAAGSGPRSAFPLSCLGMGSCLIGKVGEDIYGREILRTMNDYGLSSTGIENESNLQTGLCVSLVRKDGERSLVSFLGSVSTTTEEVIMRHYDLIEKADFLLVTGYFNLAGVNKEAWMRILKKAKNDGKHVLFDPGWDVQNWKGRRREDVLSLLHLVDTFLPNRDEAVVLSGKESPEEMAHHLQKAGAGEVIIKLDKEGSAGYSPQEGFVSKSALPVNAVDTTAAGEAFNAGIVFGLVHGWKLEQRLTCANALAGLFISNPGRKYPNLGKLKQNMEGLENA